MPEPIRLDCAAIWAGLSPDAQRAVGEIAVTMAVVWRGLAGHEAIDTVRALERLDVELYGQLQDLVTAEAPATDRWPPPLPLLMGAAHV